jgi:hypothetical protein
MTGNALPTLILIHGATANGRMWDPLRRNLDPRFRVLTLDLGSRRCEAFTLQGAIDTVIAAAYSVSGSPIIVRRPGWRANARLNLRRNGERFRAGLLRRAQDLATCFPWRPGT